MATKRSQQPERPYTLTVTLTIPRARLAEVKAAAKRQGLTLDEHCSNLVAGTVQATVHGERRGRASHTPDKCRHDRTRPEGKVDGMRVCVDCGTRLV